MILEPLAFKRSRSLKKLERRGILEVRLDTCFAEVMGNCAKVPREGQRGSWISKKMIRAYGRLHERGIAHSVEVFEDDVLVGGLYGLAMGGVFFGESMFHRRRDASKIALSHLCRLLEAWDFDMVDCQQETAHLASLGAAPIRRTAFNARLQRSLVGGDRWGRRR
ncbi:MAG: leucyl/phenylalanyl-tRNA--protein transferase, partial [Myxococcota bacterium]